MKSNHLLIRAMSGIILFAALSGLNAQYPWKNQVSPTDSNIVSLHFIDNLQGWITTEQGIIYTTEDAGLSWQNMEEIENITPTKIFFVNDTLGWLTGAHNYVLDSAFIMRTTDGGDTWQPVLQHMYYEFNDVFFINDTLGFVAGSEISQSDTLSLIMFTTDQGVFWDMPVGIRVHSNLQDIHFRNINDGFACGMDGLFLSTHNGGLLDPPGWSLDISIPSYDKDLYGIYNGGSNYGCSVGEDGFILFTSNNWTSYTDHNNTSSDTLVRVSGTSDGLQNWAVGKNGCITSIKYITFLFSVMVSEETRVTANDLNDVYVIDANNIWAVGDNGTILYYNPNYAPVATNDEVSVMQDDTVIISVLDNDTDFEGDDLSIHSFSQGNHGVVSFVEGNDFLTYNPDDLYLGNDTIMYIVTDKNGGYDTGWVFITVTLPNMGPFVQIATGFDSVAFGNAIWGDVDNDKDYDVLICGEKSDGEIITALYINNEGIFEKDAVEFEGVSPKNDRSMAFTDLENDGLLDVIICGENNEGNYVTNLYIHNSYYYFSKYETGITGVTEGSVDWGDYDNDGDPDLLISGKSGVSSSICQIYRNDGEGEANKTWAFSDGWAHFTNLKESNARFIDFNQDDYLDVIATGINESGNLAAYNYANTGGSFLTGSFEMHYNGSMEYCDFDADGTLEILQTGDTSVPGFYPVTRLLRCDPLAFTEIETDLENVFLSSADWGDYDNDGDYDLILCGKNELLENITKIYDNEDGTLVETDISLPRIAEGSVRWGDYDYDGDLDLLLSGYQGVSSNRFTAIYQNNQDVENIIPNEPSNFTVSYVDTTITISWDKATDNETSQNALTYNIKLKRKKGKDRALDINPHTHDDGSLKITRLGNALNNSVKVKGQQEGALYTCYVQTVDAGYNTSAWGEYDFNVPSDYFLEQDFQLSSLYYLYGAKWIDYDGDNDLDLFTGGGGDGDTRIYPVIDNEVDTQFVELEHGYFNQEVHVTDIDNDNQLDFSYTSSGNIKLILSGGTDTTISTGLTGGSHAWGDFDNDGDEDLIITGALGAESNGCSLFRNNNGILEHYNILITGTYFGDIAWVDYDNDSDLDIAITGYSVDTLLGEDYPITKIYANNNGAYIDTEMALTGVWHSSFDFGDCDNDGDLDLLLCGITNESEIKTIVYRNDNNSFIETPYELTPVIAGDCKWADVNNDEYLDIVLTGINDNDFVAGNMITKIYIWDENNYEDVAEMEGFAPSFIAAGDYNNDQKTDLFIGGEETDFYPYGILYKNVTNNNNLVPEPPEKVNVYAYGDSVLISWLPGEDNLYPGSMLTYNLRIGTTPGGSEVMSAKANSNGFRKVTGPGNLLFDTSCVLKNLDPDQVYYAAVQCIDMANFASKFTNELAFNPISGCFIPKEFITDDETITNALWADTDSDKDLDLLVRKEGLGSNPAIYENNNGDIVTSATEYNTISFTNELLVNDYDNDNDVDLLLLPNVVTGPNNMLINNNGTFTVDELDVSGLLYSNSAWADYNNDGDQDLIVMGVKEGGTDLHTYLYRNIDLSFDSVFNLLEPSCFGQINWVDLKNDGYKDMVRCGYTKSFQAGPEDVKFIITENIRGGFMDTYPNLPGFILCDMDFGDYDNDGDMDMVYIGGVSNELYPHSYICKNNNGAFSIVDSITSVYAGSCKWLDVNNDGLLDIIISGNNDLISNYNLDAAIQITEIFLNTGDSFEKCASLETFSDPILAIGDYDNDGRTDLFIGGKSDSDTTGIIYRNSNSIANTVPSEITTFDAIVYTDSVKIGWNMGLDDESTARAGLCYNLRIGKTPGGSGVLSPVSHGDGYRKLVDFGNIGHKTSFTLKDFEPSTTYYYSVQAIDQAYAGSSWSIERNFETPAITATNDIVEAKHIRVYPNPVDDILTIEIVLDEQANAVIQMYNETGQKILYERIQWKKGMNQSQIKIPGKGIFLVRILSGEHITTRKIIKL